jgi:hypothetical protein
LKANRGKGTNGFESLLTSTLTSTEYDQNHFGSGSVTTKQATDSIDILTAAFADAGFSFTLEEDHRVYQQRLVAAGPGTSTNMKQRCARETRLPQRLTNSAWRRFVDGYPSFFVQQ